VRHDPQRPGFGLLYRIPVFGGRPEKVIDDVDSPVSFSPDGSEMVFVRDRNEQNSKLVIAHSDGTDERVIGEQAGPMYEDPAWAPEGSRVAVFLRNSSNLDRPTVQVLNVVDGKQIKSYTVPDADPLSNLNWTPNARYLIFRGESQVEALSLSDGKIHRITTDFNDYVDLSLSRNGKQLVALVASSEHELFTMNSGPAGNSTPLLVASQFRGARWLPDGRLLFVDNDGRILAMNSDGSNQTTVLQDSHASGRVSVCSDGRHALYDAIGKIWTLDLKTYDANGLTNGNVDTSPVCSPDSTYAIYLTLSKGNESNDVKQVLMRMSLTGGPAKQMSDKEVFSAAFSPNGREIAMVTPSSSTNPGMVIDVIPSEGGLAEKSFQAAGLNLAPSGLQYSRDGKAIYYATNKRRIGNILMQAISGGDPNPVTDFRNERLFDFEYDWKHEKLAVERGTLGSDIVLITDASDNIQK
jgi:Tol biopolymer transport system component